MQNTKSKIKEKYACGATKNRLWMWTSILDTVRDLAISFVLTRKGPSGSCMLLLRIRQFVLYVSPEGRTIIKNRGIKKQLKLKTTPCTRNL